MRIMKRAKSWSFALYAIDKIYFQRWKDFCDSSWHATGKEREDPVDYRIQSLLALILQGCVILKPGHRAGHFFALDKEKDAFKIDINY